MKYIILCLLSFNCLAAKPLIGEVISVHDGDTFTMRSNQKSYRIRLAGIDAPELKQSQGWQSRVFLCQLICGKSVLIIRTGRSYKRIVGRVYIDAKNIGDEMVKNGYAWSEPRYDKLNYYLNMQNEAVENHLGLWNDSNPVAPWIWRDEQRKNKRI